MSSVAHRKHVISISLGSSERDAQVAVQLGDVELLVERRGTDGDFAKARQLMEQYDGKVDAMGLGGTDLYVYAGKERYTFRESAKLVANVKSTPVLDGSGLKNSLERRLIRKLAGEGTIDFKNKKVFLVCGVDRFGMAEALQEADLVVVTTAHTKVDYAFVQRHSKMIFDTKNAMKNVESRDNIELL